MKTKEEIEKKLEVLYAGITSETVGTSTAEQRHKLTGYMDALEWVLDQTSRRSE